MQEVSESVFIESQSLSWTWIMEWDAVKHVSVEYQLFSQLEGLLLSRACAVGSVWPCEQHEAPLHPSPSAEAEQHRGRESEETDQESDRNVPSSVRYRLVLLTEVTLFVVCLSVVEGEDGEENFSLDRSFIPNSSLILLKTTK